MTESRPRTSDHYALVTAAYNEEAFIEATIRSVVGQTHKPVSWVIVSDGSIDRTDDIVQSYASRIPFIKLLRIVEPHDRNWSAQVHAINRGFAAMGELEYEYIGNLDADISLEPDYFKLLLDRFRVNKRLGLGGGAIWEKKGATFKPRASNSNRSVPLALQLFRRECFESLHPYHPMKYGGTDWHAEVLARMNGWEVHSFPDLRVFHHRATGTAGGQFALLAYWWCQGLMDFSFGTAPAFEIVKMSRRLSSRPYVLGASARLLAFTLAYLGRHERLVPPEMMQFLRKEQKRRLLNPFRKVFVRS
jgi:hypothetical protein